MGNHHQKTSQRETTGPLISEFSGDADMTELIEFFLSELQQGIQRLQQAWEDGDRQQLTKLAHQLKGAAGGYGFPSITSCAAELEQTSTAAEAQASAVAEKLEALIALCKRAVAAS